VYHTENPDKLIFAFVCLHQNLAIQALQQAFDDPQFSTM